MTMTTAVRQLFVHWSEVVALRRLVCWALPDPECHRQMNPVTGSRLATHQQQ